MRRAIVSFEDETIKVIYATVKGKDVVVDDTLILKSEQFDDFLRKEKAKEFIVVNSFKDFFQETILIPPTKKRFIKKLIETEISKRSQFKNFSFLYTISGEKIAELRKMKEVSVFAVKKEDIKDIVDRFVLKGKIVKAIYPDIFSVACLIEQEQEPFLCISEAGLNKSMFLVKDGIIQFIRIARSTEKGIRDVDIQGINMTINHCRQTLKINPSAIMLVGSLCSDYNVTTNPLIIPVACLSPRISLTRIDSLHLDFIPPLSSILIPEDRDINILSGEYKNLFRTRQFLRYSTILFLMLSVLGIGYAGCMWNNITELKNKLNSLRLNLPDIDNTLTLYDLKKTELSGYMPIVTSLRNAAAIPDIQNFLSSVSELKIDNIRIDSISITASDNTFKAELKGLVKTDNFAGMQAHYQKLIDSILLKGFTIKGHRLELKDKSFHIEMEYR